MAMISIMVFITTANFYAVIMKKNEKNKLIYIIYGILLIGFYLFLSLEKIDFIVLNLIKRFYEITYLEPYYWEIVAVISVVSSAALIILQFIRARIIRKSES